MPTPSNARVELILESCGYSPLFIRPVWYRFFTLLGIPLRNPAVMSLGEHVACGGILSLLVFTGAFGMAWALGLISDFPRSLVLLLSFLMPVVNWLRYSRLRREIERRVADGAVDQPLCHP